MEAINYVGNKPQRQAPTDAGADLVAGHSGVIPAGGFMVIDTRTAIDLPAGYAGLVVSRSGLGLRGIRVRNSIGVIDPGYRSNIRVALENISDTNFSFHEGDRIAQLLIVPVELSDFTESKQGFETGRGGFGSTGVA